MPGSIKTRSGASATADCTDRILERPLEDAGVGALAGLSPSHNDLLSMNCHSDGLIHCVHKTGTHVMLAQTTACSSWLEETNHNWPAGDPLIQLSIQFGLTSSDIVDNFNDRLLPLPAIWTFPGHRFPGPHGYITRSQVSVRHRIPQASCLRTLHSQGVAGTHSHARREWGALLQLYALRWLCLPSVHQAQLALVLHDPVHLLSGAQSDPVWSPAKPHVGFPVPFSQQMRGAIADAGLPCLDAAGLMGTLGTSSPLDWSAHYSGSPAVATEATPPRCLDGGACCHSLWRTCPIGLPVPLHCHLWVVVGQIIAGARCFATLVGASGAQCAIAYSRLPLVRQSGLAQAAAPPGLSGALGRYDDAAQVGISLVVPLLLQVWSQPADIRASLLIRLACKQRRCCCAVVSNDPEQLQRGARQLYLPGVVLISLCMAGFRVAVWSRLICSFGSVAVRFLHIGRVASSMIHLFGLM